MLEALELGDIRVRDALLRMSGAQELFNESLDRANNAWVANIALMEESEKAYGTTESDIQKMKNAWADLAIELKDVTLPTLSALAGMMTVVAGELSTLIGFVKEFNATPLEVEAFRALTGAGNWGAVARRLIGGEGTAETSLAEVEKTKDAYEEIFRMEQGFEETAAAAAAWAAQIKQEMEETGDTVDEETQRWLDFLERLRAALDAPKKKEDWGGINDALVTLHPTILMLTSSIEQQRAVVEAQQIAYDGMAASLHNMQREAMETQNRISELSRELSEASKRLNELSRPRIKGQGAMEERAFQLEGVLRRIKLAELQGGPVKLTEAMEKALGGGPLDPELIQRMIESLRTQIDDLLAEPTRRIQQIAEGERPEVTAEAAIDAYRRQKEHVEALQAAIAGETAALREQQGAIRDMQERMYEWSQGMRKAEDKLKLTEKAHAKLRAILKKVLEQYPELRDQVLQFGWESAISAGTVDASIRKMLDAIVEYTVEEVGAASHEIFSLAAAAEIALARIIAATKSARDVFSLIPQEQSMVDEEGNTWTGWFQKAGQEGDASSLPGAQHGGIFTRPSVIQVAEGGEAEAVIPLTAGGLGGGDIHLHAGVFMGTRSEARELAQILREYLNEEQRLRLGKGNI
jgi:hypothetical protein